MFSSRFVLLLLLVLLCWGMNVSAQVPYQVQPAQPQPTQTQPFTQPPVRTMPLQMQPVQMQQIQTQPMAPQTQFDSNIRQPIRVAQAGQPHTLYDPNNVNRTPLTIQSNTVQQPFQQQPIQPIQQVPSTLQTVPNVVLPNPAPSTARIVPFVLNPDEQRELDDFLLRWEKYSAGIKRYDVNFYLFEYDPTIPGAVPNQPARTCFGYFRYVATPVRFAYVVEGEYRDGKYIKREGEKNPHIHAEKMIIAENAVYKYDYNSTTIYQINVPPELIGKGIADSPLPLIFGAKADELKRRFSMKAETLKDAKGNGELICLYARPLLIEDQQEFKELIIMLEKKDLRARGLQQNDINGKSYKRYNLTDTKINNRLENILEDLSKIFQPIVERGWKKVDADYQVVQPSVPSPALPIGAPGIPRPQMGNPQPSSGIPLYQIQ